jgi:dTDP-4-dehydrorhamnose 3,5-epimerase
MLPGLKLLTPRVFADERGHFFESWSESRFSEEVGDVRWVQDNESMSVRGTLRGLHFQKEPHAQAKLVRVVVGRVWDVAVDIRPGSATFGKWEAVELSAENKHQLYIPKGFAHGFLVLSDHAIFQYKVDAPWNRESEACIRWNDPSLAIDWPLPESELIISEKDRMGRELRVVSSEL